MPIVKWFGGKAFVRKSLAKKVKQRSRVQFNIIKK
jgi:hypothetical protein